jgi:hypothetical protein
MRLKGMMLPRSTGRRANAGRKQRFQALRTLYSLQLTGRARGGQTRRNDVIERPLIERFPSLNLTRPELRKIIDAVIVHELDKIIIAVVVRRVGVIGLLQCLRGSLKSKRS